MSETDVLEVLRRLEASGIAVSLAGGWAVDALLGRVTREHDDLDLAIDADDVERAVITLGEMGLTVETDERPARLALGDGTHAVDLHPVAWDATGTGRQAGLGGLSYVYPPGSTAAVGRIGSRAVRCLTADLLLEFHLGYEPRIVDRQDMAALAERFELELPAPYGRV